MFYLIYEENEDSVLNSNNSLYAFVVEKKDQTRDDQFHIRICRPTGTKQWLVNSTF